MVTETGSKETSGAGVSLVIITGLSGAGKSTAMRCFEDLGWYCVDNLPPSLVPTFYGLYRHSYPVGRNVAIASDLRSGNLFGDFARMVEELKKVGTKFEKLYLDCSAETLINRFRAVRRAHPLQAAASVEEAIESEKQALEPVREIATRIIDTSDYSSNDLREALIRFYVSQDTSDAIKIEFVSFGFKYGIPLDADFVFDVRFLPNPFYIPELASQTGEHESVYRYVMEQKQAEAFFRKVAEIIALTLDDFIGVGKFNLVVGIGCTGGRHRSVAFAKRLAEHFQNEGYHAAAHHRDHQKPQN